VAVLAIDPGTTKSGWVRLEGGVPVDFDKSENYVLRDIIASGHPSDQVVIEMVASYGMAVGAEVFETCVWIGRLFEVAVEHSVIDPIRVYRRDVKLHLCGQTRAKDANVRQALIDRYGGKDKAIGKKASPGPCYGMSGDVWQALALAVTVHDGAVS
jgi:hypothetical protein